MTSMDRWIERHRRRLALGRFLERFAEGIAAFLFAFGGVVLAVKLVLPSLWPQVLWLGVAAVPMAVLAWYLAQRNPYSRTESIAMIDHKLDAGGLLMTLCEHPDAGWQARLPVETAWQNSLPKLRPIRFTRYVALPVVFAVAACLIPPREARTEMIRPNAVGRDAADQLKETLNLLQETNVLEEKQKEELRKAIEKLTEDTADTPLTHEKWETVDALRDKLRMQAESASMLVEQGAGAASILSAAENGSGESLSADRREQLEKDVLEAIKKLSAGNNAKGMSSEMAKKLSQLSANGKLNLPKDAAERAKTLGELKDYLAQESKKLGECRSKCCAQCNGAGCKACKAGMCAGQCSGNKPGRGGITRGRGDAELTWGDESSGKDTRFKEVALPPGFVDEPKEDVTGVTLAQPEVKPAESAPRAALRSNDPATGKETWNRPLRPRHRAVVRKYFDSSNSQPSGASGEKTVP